MAKPESPDIFGRPGIDPGRAAVENAIVRGGRRWAVSVDGVHLFARFGILGEGVLHAAIWADLRITQGRARLLLDGAGFLPTIGALLTDAPVPAALPPDLAAAVVALVLDSIPGADGIGLGLDSAGLGAPSAPFVPRDAADWRLSVRIEDEAGRPAATGSLYCDEGVAVALARALEAGADGAAAPLVEPDAVGRVQLASIHVALADFERLQPMDILVSGAYGLGGRAAVRLFFAPGLFFFGTLDGEVITMSTQENQGSPNQDPAPSGMAELDKLPVRIGFELGSVTVTLSELRTMAAGAVVEIPAPLDSPVLLRANGREIGRGALLRVGDHLGVRILELWAPPEQNG